MAKRNADHIHPHAKGGTDDILNLITSCERCNSGKSDVPLSDQSAIERQRKQIEQLQERRDQLDMMLQWREGLKGIQSAELTSAVEHWEQLTWPWDVSDEDRKTIKLHIKNYGLLTVLDCMDEAAAKYVKDSDGGPAADKKSVADAFKKLGGFLYYSKNPGEKERAYVKGIMRNRNIRSKRDDELIDKCVTAGATWEQIKRVAAKTKNFYTWDDDMEALAKTARGE